MKEDLLAKIDDYRSSLDHYLSDLRDAKVRRKDSMANVREYRILVDHSSQAYQFLQTMEAEVQKTIHDRISAIVSRCLEAVFDDPYHIDIQFERRANRTEAIIRMVRCDTAVNPLSASGGGVVDVLAFALRLACLSLQKQKLRKLVVLDEPFRFVSSEYRPRLRNLIHHLAEEMDFQFIIVTHIDDFQMGSVISI